MCLSKSAFPLTISKRQELIPYKFHTFSDCFASYDTPYWRVCWVALGAMMLLKQVARSMGLIKGCYQVILFIITFGPATYCRVLTFAHFF